jgi:denticleless
MRRVEPLGRPLVITSGDGSCPPFCCEFGVAPRTGRLLAVADENGVVSIVDTDCASTTAQRGSAGVMIELPSAHRCRWAAHRNAVFDIAWGRDDCALLTASGDFSVRLWDVSSQQCRATMKGHEGSVKSVCFSPGDAGGYTLASASRDGNVFVWDTRAPQRPVVTMFELHSRPGARVEVGAIAGVAYAPDGRTLVTAGANDGCVKVWDLRRAPAGKSKSGGAPWSARLWLSERSTPRRRRGGALAERVTPMHSLLAGEFDSAATPARILYTVYIGIEL